MTTSKEFVRWKVYLDESINDFNPEYYYFALIAMILAKVNARTEADGNKIKLEDFLLKFETKAKKLKKVDPKTKEALAKMNKKMFLAGLGVNPDNPIPIEKPKKTPIRRLENKTPLKKK